MFRCRGDLVIESGPPSEDFTSMRGALEDLKRGLLIGTGIFIALVSGLATLLWAESLHRFQAGDLISADQINANFQKMAPVGTILAWHRDWGATPALPDGWVQCNGQIVNDSDSVFNGLATPNLNSPSNAWNSRGSFLRGGANSGLFESDQMQSHKHDDAGHAHLLGLADLIGSPGGFNTPDFQPGSNHIVGATQTASAVLGDPTDSGSGAARHGTETRPANMSVIWIIRIK